MGWKCLPPRGGQHTGNNRNLSLGMEVFICLTQGGSREDVTESFFPRVRCIV